MPKEKVENMKEEKEKKHRTIIVRELPMAPVRTQETEEEIIEFKTIEEALTEFYNQEKEM